MQTAAVQLKRWQRLLAVQTVQRDSIVLRQQQLESGIASAVSDQADFKQAVRNSGRAFVSAAVHSDFALRTAIAADRQSHSVSAESATQTIESLRTQLEASTVEAVKVQKLITVLETRIDECQVAARHEANRRAQR